MGFKKETLQETGARIAAAFERAPFEELGWDSALRILAEATGSAHGELLAMGGRHLAFNWASDVDDEFHHALDAIDGYNPQLNYRIGASGAPMVLAWEDHYDAVRKANPGGPYVDAVHRLRVQHGIQTVLAQQPGAFFGLAVLRGDDEGRSTERQRQIFADAASHVLAAIRVQNAIEHQGALMVQGSMEAMGTPAILLDVTGRVCFVTAAAARLLGSDTLQIRGKELHAPRHDIDRLLQAKIALALAGIDSGPADLWIRSDRGLVLADVRALPKQEWHFGMTPRIIVSLRSPIADTPGVAPDTAAVRLNAQAAHVSAALGLTEAEAQVVALLARGMSRRDVAAVRAVSPQTVTSQLRTIFLKTGVRREGELVAIARAVIDIAH